MLAERNTRLFEKGSSISRDCVCNVTSTGAHDNGSLSARGTSYRGILVLAEFFERYVRDG